MWYNDKVNRNIVFKIGGAIIKAFMKKITISLFAFTLIMLGAYIAFEIDLFQTLAITLGTTFYHFAMRLLVGYLYLKRFDNKISWQSKWFQVKKGEVTLYKILRVKRWKKYIPTYDSTSFDIKTKSYEQIAMAMCQAELVHETIMVLSFLPIIASIWLGAIEVFVITSVMSAMIDLVFVILQRYNRPRILKMVQATSHRHSEYHG